MTIGNTLKSYPDISIGQLHLFLKISECGSIAAAAREVGIDPSVAVRRLANIEKMLDIKLVRRNTRGLRLTDAGKIVLDWATGAIGRQEEVVERLAELSLQPRGAIRIAAANSFLVNVLPDFILEFSEKYPDIIFNLQTRDDPSCLLSDEIDLMVHGGEISDHNLICRRLLSYERILCASPRYLERAGVPETLEQLAQLNCIVHGPSGSGALTFRKGEHSELVSLKTLLSSDDHLVIYEMTLAGVGIGCISDAQARKAIQAGRLVQILPDYMVVNMANESPSLWIVYPDRRVSKKVRLCIDALIDYMKREG